MNVLVQVLCDGFMFGKELRLCWERLIGVLHQHIGNVGFKTIIEWSGENWLDGFRPIHDSILSRWQPKRIFQRLVRFSLRDVEGFFDMRRCVVPEASNVVLLLENIYSRERLLG